MLEDKEQSLIDYLLINEALGEKVELNSLIDLAKQSYQGRHLAITNPLEKEIALLFEMIMQNGFDPWNIDLKKFSELYLEHVTEEEIDLPSAGMLILMAWQILRLQSEGVVRLVEGERSEGIGWDEISPFEPMVRGQEENKPIECALEEKIRHKAERKVTLLELIGALRDAFEEAKVFLSRKERNKKRIKRELELAKEVIGKILSRENIEADLNQFLAKLNKFDGGQIGLKKLCNLEERGEFIHSLVPMLFLAKERKISVWQTNFPYGNIYLRRINGFGKAED
jgi:segregation and condensation protein A